MDRMIGGDFEAGLCNLKGIAEGPPGTGRDSVHLTDTTLRAI
jgi:hypothetical protein